MSKSDLITSVEVAALLGLSVRQVNRMVERGERPRPVFVAPGKTGQRLFDRDDVERVAQDRKEPAA